MNKKVLSNIITNRYNSEYVYDISLDGTVINALGNNVCSNTDGFNFQMPQSFKYTDENPYISKGLGRNYKKDEAFTLVKGDVAEFEDLFLRGKMGLGIDEYADATINFSRKNYADLLTNGKIKYVGNTIKSKKMPVYIEKFMEKGIKLLLNGKGNEFLNYYYDTIEKIYNYEIPLRDIASKGKIKKSIKEYKEDCNTIIKTGRTKNRQVWYELCILNNIEPTIGDTIYYINTGDGKTKSTYKDVSKKNIKGKDGSIEKIELIINCVMIKPDVIEAEEDTFCTSGLEYNAQKYIEQFNSRIKPLLLCFSPNIRESIIIKTPEKRQYYTEQDSILDSGNPNKIEDQDSYYQLLTIEDKEIKFWIDINEEPPFLNELGLKWEEIVSDYNIRMEILKEENISKEVTKYNNIINELTSKEVEDFITDIKVPNKISEFLRLDSKTLSFISKEYNVQIGTIYDIVDKELEDDENETDE